MVPTVRAASGKERVVLESVLLPTWVTVQLGQRPDFLYGSEYTKDELPWW